MIDTLTEALVTMAQAARETPNRAGGRGVNVSTTCRWFLRGIAGVKLETILIGGVRYTSREALQRFFAAATAAADGTPNAGTPKQREREIAAAEAELASL